jgi:Cu/Ag efflux protein CusF
MKLTAMVLMGSMLFASSALASTDTPRLSTATGHVASIDGEANSMVVKMDGPNGDSQDVTFVAAADSKIIKDGTAIALADLKQGEKVTITYKSQEGKNVIVNIGVESKS